MSTKDSTPISENETRWADYAPLYRIETKAGPVILMPDGCWFEFADDGDGEPLRPVTPPDEQIYAYSHGGDRYRAAIRGIAAWKEANSWGVTD